MDWKNEKCVLVIDGNLPLGIIANTAAILGITLGKKMPEVVGEDVTDGSGNIHLGIIEFPVPVLKGTPEVIREIREKLYQPEFQDLTAVDFPTWRRAAKPTMNSLKNWVARRRVICNISASRSAETGKG